LDEFTGNVKQFEKITKPEYAVKYLDLEDKEYFIDATEAGSILRFIRKSRSKGLANVALRAYT
jgi:SET domain-containing protein